MSRGSASRSFLRLRWDGTTEDIVVGRIGRADFRLIVDEDGGLKAESI